MSVSSGMRDLPEKAHTKSENPNILTIRSGVVPHERDLRSFAPRPGAAVVDRSGLGPHRLHPPRPSRRGGRSDRRAREARRRRPREEVIPRGLGVERVSSRPSSHSTMRRLDLSPPPLGYGPERSALPVLFNGSSRMESKPRSSIVVCSKHREPKFPDFLPTGLCLSPAVLPAAAWRPRAGRLRPASDRPG